VKTKKQIELDIEISNIEAIVSWDFIDHNLNTLKSERKSIAKIKKLLEEERQLVINQEKKDKLLKLYRLLYYYAKTNRQLKEDSIREQIQEIEKELEE